VPSLRSLRQPLQLKKANELRYYEEDLEFELDDDPKIILTVVGNPQPQL
jgi:hypothetical protein